MHQGKAKSAQLIIFEDGTIYHIDLKRADNIPTNILLVGAVERVDAIAEQFDSVRFRHHNPARPEFYVAAGTYKGKDVAAMSIGIGVDNTEIVLNELHALFEYDHAADTWSDARPLVNFIRVGTCGAPHADIPAGAFAVSEYAIGLDNLGVYYPYLSQDPRVAIIEAAFKKTLVGSVHVSAYCSMATPRVAQCLMDTARAAGETEKTITSGITVSAPGFFAPEGRQIGRLKSAFGFGDFLKVMREFSAADRRIVDFEMESSILFRIGHEQLGYNVGTICLVVDNLETNDVIAADKAAERMRQCIHIALEAIITL